MNKPRAISAQLVDIRNVGAHKSIKLTIHVPEEQARQVVDLFGWPTMVDPVPVALARLQEGGGAHAQQHPTIDTTPVSPSDKPAGRAKREWHELKPSAQISIRCGETAFRAFLAETFPDAWNRLEATTGHRSRRRSCLCASTAALHPAHISISIIHRPWMPGNGSSGTIAPGSRHRRQEP